jgi:hypothetical protein
MDLWGLLKKLAIERVMSAIYSRPKILVEDVAVTIK